VHPELGVVTLAATSGDLGGSRPHACASAIPGDGPTSIAMQSVHGAPIWACCGVLVTALPRLWKESESPPSKIAKSVPVPIER